MILINSDLNDTEKKLLFVSGVLLSLAQDLSDMGGPGSQDAEVARITEGIVYEVLQDVSGIVIDPDAPAYDIEGIALHAKLRAAILAGRA